MPRMLHRATLLNLFQRKNCKTKEYPIVGKTTVYLKHDEYLGKCLIHENNFITPNMPKLQYLLKFKIEEDKLTLLDELQTQVKQAFVFEKRDGFNLLFYLWKEKVIPKTRLAPIATGTTRKIISHPLFPIQQITKMVKDGLIPIFEVWGTVLEKFRLVHGQVNFQRVQSLTGLPELNVELITVLRADYERGLYRYFHPSQMIQIAEQYGLRTPPLIYVGPLTPSKVKQLMKEASEQNRKHNTVIIEGYVAHLFNEKYQMFKIKPIEIMETDVILKGIPKQRVLRELTKILIETPLLEIARNPNEYMEELLKYLKEDYPLNAKIKRKITAIAIQEIAEQLLAQNPNLTPETAGRLGIHKWVIGAIIKQKEERKWKRKTKHHSP
ncbi:MAG TPA: hypothetical protein ENG66_05535 [Thermococcus sp.]|nr:hypothetical protein [Thermococcus sp.]